MRVGTEKSMNNTKKLRSALLSSLTIIASIVLGHTAQAASLYFREAGAQLDGDNILDINVIPGQQIEFKIFVDTQVMAINIVKLTYHIWFDPKELAFRNIGPGNGADVSDKETLSGPNDPITVFEVGKENINIAKNLPRVHITTITFDVVKPGLKPDDGQSDFKITRATGRDENGVVIPFWGFRYGPRAENELFQRVEVQTPEPTSILGLFSLGIIGVGATIKRQVKRNHSIEKETTEIG